MYGPSMSILAAALLGVVHAQQPHRTAVQTAQITAAPAYMDKRAEIYEYIELHQDYGAPIGVDTRYLTPDGSSTKWIGANTQYLTEEIVVTTVTNVPTTTVVKPQLSVVTATVAAEGIAVGDVTVLVVDVVQKELTKVVKTAIASCGGGGGIAKRADMSCMLNALTHAAEDDNILRLVNGAEWDAFRIQVFQDAPAVLVNAVQLVKTRAHLNRVALLTAAASLMGAFTTGYVILPNAEAAHKYVFQKGGFGSSDKHPNKKPVTSTTATSSTSTRACDPSETVNENSPACDDKDCEGNNDHVCQAQGDKHLCKCAPWVTDVFVDDFGKDWFTKQRPLLKEALEMMPDGLSFDCIRNSFGDGFNGKPLAEPSAFCFCSAQSLGRAVTSGSYPTIMGVGDNGRACAYKSMPTATISITTRPRETKVTSCRTVTTGEPYCTCNDDAQHDLATSTLFGKATAVCPDAVATLADYPPIKTPEANLDCLSYSDELKCSTYECPRDFYRACTRDPLAGGGGGGDYCGCVPGGVIPTDVTRQSCGTDLSCRRFNCGDDHFATCDGIANVCVCIPRYGAPPEPRESCRGAGGCRRYKCGPDAYPVCLADDTCGCRIALPPPKDHWVAESRCGKDADCGAFRCPRGQWVECLNSQCSCRKSSAGKPPADALCRGDWDCRMFTCDQGQIIGCPVSQRGGTGTCQCLSRISLVPAGATVKCESQSQCDVYYCADSKEHVECSAFIAGGKGYCRCIK